MPDVGGIGGVPPQQAGERGQVSPVAQGGAQAEGLPAPTGEPGPLGQPTGLPAPPLAPGRSLLPDAVAGRDPSQLVAAEQMRARGGASAVETLLGLDRAPTILGALAPPPGNSEALRHMTPTMRRAVMRQLLDKQRAKMRRLAYLLRRERGDGEDDADGRERGRESFEEEMAGSLLPPDEAAAARARLELGSAARMLDLLEELLAMQDYAISQMGTFSHG